MADRTQSRRRGLRVLGASLIAGGVAMIGLALTAGPATANDTPGPVVASTKTVAPEGLVNSPNGGDDDQCTRDACKRIKWCGSKDNKVVQDDAPVVAVPKGAKEPECIKEPTINKVVCCEGGVGDVTVTVDNPNCTKLRVSVTVDNGPPVVKWIDANGSADFKFSHVGNGDHTISASALVKQGLWCNFAKIHFTVKCSTPSASASRSHSASPSPSVSKSVSPSPSHSHSVSPSASVSRSTGVMPPANNASGKLPLTGMPVWSMVIAGLLLVAVGVLAVRLASRRRVRLVNE